MADDAKKAAEDEAGSPGGPSVGSSDRVSALEWPADHLVLEARRRGLDAPAALTPATPSLHLVE